MGDEAKDSGTKVDVTMPLGFTDAVKAIREVLGLLGDVTAKVGAVSEALERHKGKRSANAIDTLAFHSDGSRKHLEKIAAGEGRKEDFEAIAEKMDETGAAVEKALDRLSANRDFIRQRYGMQVANRIGDLLYAGGGKQSIRLDLEMLARMDDKFYSSDKISAEAQHIMSNIEALNAGLVEIHDLLAGVKKA